MLPDATAPGQAVIDSCDVVEMSDLIGNHGEHLLHEAPPIPEPCICGYDRRGLSRLAACPECGKFDEPRDPPALWSQAVGFTWLAIILAGLDAVFAVCILVLNLQRPEGADEFATLVPITCWFYAVLPIAGLALLLVIASVLSKKVGAKDPAFKKTLSMACTAMFGPPRFFLLLVLLWASIGFR